MQHVSLVAGLAIVVMGPGVFAWAVVRLVRRQLARPWPVVTGTVVAFRGYPGLRIRHRYTGPEFELEYRYRVGDAEFTRKELVPPDYMTRSDGFLRKLETLDPGAGVDVHVHPRDPARASVAPGAGERYAILVLLISGLISAGTVWAIARS